ncbi:MAG: hypothetical protein Q3993_07235, partial [Filifactor alocis]|nr:hypothetical protein [Filifactor alocis]
ELCWRSSERLGVLKKDFQIQKQNWSSLVLRNSSKTTRVDLQLSSISAPTLDRMSKNTDERRGYIGKTYSDDATIFEYKRKI